MKKYFLEDDEYSTDPQVKKVLKILRDNNFGNEASRKQLIDLITTLHNSNDKTARKALKAIGDLFSDIADDLIESKKIERDEIMKRYDKKFNTETLKEFGLTGTNDISDVKDSRDTKIIYQIMMRFAKQNGVSPSKADFIINKVLDIFFAEVKSKANSSEMGFLKNIGRAFDKRFEK